MVNRYGVFSLFAATLVSLLASNVNAQLVVDLSVDVTEQNGVYTYLYTLENSAFSGLPVNGFLLDTGSGAVVDSIEGPENWVAVYDASQSNLQAAFLAGEGFDCATEDFDIFEGETTTFTIVSTWAPADQEYNVAKFTSDCLDFLGFTVGEIASPSIPTVAEMTCDFDGDGDCDLVDIDALAADIAAGTNTVSFDLTSDGVVNSDDLDQFLTDTNNINGDSDLVGGVAFPDFLVLSSNFGKDGIAWSGGDFAPNGAVDFADFLILSSNFGQSAAAQSGVPVPEPSSSAIATLAFCCLASLRRRSR